jgi:type I restriction enzyme S subunit
LDAVNRVSQATYEEWTRRAKPKESDLILAREAPIGNVAIIPKNLKVCLGQRTVLIRPNREKVNPHFLLYLLLGNEIQSKFQAFSGGATVAHLNMEEIRKLELPKIPNRIIQQKIAAILSAYDDLIENNLRRIKILEEMAQTLYREWFVKFRFPGHQKVKMVNSPLGKIPEGWEIKRLGEVIELAYGKGLKEQERIPGDVPVFGSSGVIGYHNQSLVNGPGIIVGRKGNVGSVYWTDAAFSPIDTVFYVITELPLHYVYFNLRTQNFISGDAAVPGLNRNQAYSLPFILPKPEVLRFFSQTVEPIFYLLNLLKRKNDLLRQTRDLLLPKLISGELDVSELDITIPEANA